jgi:predicted transcriptional regulator
MADTEAFIIRVPTEVKVKLEALAQSTNRSRSWLAAQAIALYVEQESWQIQSIEEALVDADSPQAHWVDGAKVDAWLASWGTADKQPAPCG